MTTYPKDYDCMMVLHAEALRNSNMRHNNFAATVIMIFGFIMIIACSAVFFHTRHVIATIDLARRAAQCSEQARNYHITQKACTHIREQAFDSADHFF